MSRSKTVFVDSTLLEEAAIPVGIDDDPWGHIDSGKWKLKEIPLSAQVGLSEPVMIIDPAPPFGNTEDTDLLLMMMVDACCSPGFQGEPTKRISQADIRPVPEVPVHVRHPRLVKRTRSITRLVKAT